MDYDIVDDALVWGIIEVKLPILIAQAGALLDSFSETLVDTPDDDPLKPGE